MIHTGSEFEVIFQALSLDTENAIRDFRDVSTIASIPDDEFWDDYKRRKSDYLEVLLLKQSFVTKLTKLSKTKPKPRHLAQIRSSKKALNEIKNVNKQRQNKPRFVARTSTPRAKRTSITLKSVHFNNASQPIQPKPRKVTQPIQSLIPVQSNLLDLIPVDVDVLDLELDKLFLEKSGDEESDSDAVSVLCSSSDDSYHTCDENMDIPMNPQPQINGRPGVKLDVIALGPPSMETISAMPATSVYTCDKPRCGFTTSNSLHIKLHTCDRSRAHVQ